MEPQSREQDRAWCVSRADSAFHPFSLYQPLRQEKALPCQSDKEGQRSRSVVLPAVAIMMAISMMVMTVSPVAMPVPKGAPNHHGRGAIHHRRRGYHHGRSRNDHRRRICDSLRRSNDHGGRVDRNTNADGNPDARMRGQHQCGNRQACQERTHPGPAVFVLHNVFSCMVSSEDQLSPQ